MKTRLPRRSITFFITVIKKSNFTSSTHYGTIFTSTSQFVLSSSWNEDNTPILISVLCVVCCCCRYPILRFLIYDHDIGKYYKLGRKSSPATCSADFSQNGNVDSRGLRTRRYLFEKLTTTILSRDHLDDFKTESLQHDVFYDRSFPFYRVPVEEGWMYVIGFVGQH